MATAAFQNVCVTGMACAVPEHTDYTESFKERFGEREVERFVEHTGVVERHRTLPGQTASDLCFVAAQRLLEHKGYDPSTIDGLIYITQSSDYIIPATSHVLHKRLGLSQDCMVFDINLGCSGFVYGLNVVGAMIASGALKRVLLCCAEASNAYTIDNKALSDHAFSMMFGDAGSVTLLEAGEGRIQTLLKADGEGYPAIITLGISPRIPFTDIKNVDIRTLGSYMDGAEVFEFTITKVPRAFKEFFKTYGGSLEDYDYCVLHQANDFIIKQICKKIKLPLEKCPISIDRFGNTSSASIPLSIVDLYDRKKEELPERINLITSGYGVGLSWGVADFVLNKKDILPMIYTSDYFKEAYKTLVPVPEN